MTINDLFSLFLYRFLQSLSQLKVVCHYVTCTTTYIYKSQCYAKNHSVSLYLYSQENASTHFLHLNNVFWIVRLAKFAFLTYERHKLVELSFESRINCRFANNIWGSEKTINRYIFVYYVRSLNSFCKWNISLLHVVPKSVIVWI